VAKKKITDYIGPIAWGMFFLGVIAIGANMLHGISTGQTVKLRGERIPPPPSPATMSNYVRMYY
jgi:hypothetical protein